MEYNHCNDYVAITVDIEDCPVVEFPLTELFDIVNATVVDDYLDVVHDYVTQLLEDRTWLAKQSALCILRSRLCMYHRRNEGELLTLRQPALQRFISQMLHCRNGGHDPIEVPLFIRFKCPEITLPRRTRFPTAISRVSRSTAPICCSAEAHGFDSSRSNPIPDVLCSSTVKASTLAAAISTNGFTAHITDYWQNTKKGSLDGSDAALKAPFATMELLTVDTIQHTTLSLSCPGFVELQKSVVVTSATSRILD
jgi:hypothetical protein